MIRFDKLLGETPKAYLIKVCNKQSWLPKSMCKNFITNKKLGGNVELPTFIINNIIEGDINKHCPNFITPKWIVEHHTPEKIDPLGDNKIKDLER